MTNEANEKYVCPVEGCGRSFQNEAALKSHLRNRHREVASYQYRGRKELQQVDAFIENVYAPRPVDGRNDYMDGFEDGIRYDRQNLFYAIMALQQLSTLGLQQSQPVIEMAKEMRQAEGQAAQAIASELAQAMSAGNREILAALQNLSVSAQAASPNPVQRMLGIMQAIPQMLMAAQNLMGMFGMRVQPAQSGQPQQVPQSQPQVQQPSFGAAGPQPATEKDIEEAFGDQPAATV